jgi:tRNA A58 N-methylase Trm61
MKTTTETISENLRTEQVEEKDLVFPLPVGQLFDEETRSKLRRQGYDLYVLDPSQGRKYIDHAVESLSTDGHVCAHLVLLRKYDG